MHSVATRWHALPALALIAGLTACWGGQTAGAGLVPNTSVPEVSTPAASAPAHADGDAPDLNGLGANVSVPAEVAPEAPAPAHTDNTAPALQGPLMFTTNRDRNANHQSSLQTPSVSRSRSTPKASKETRHRITSARRRQRND